MHISTINRKSGQVMAFLSIPSVAYYYYSKLGIECGISKTFLCTAFGHEIYFSRFFNIHEYKFKHAQNSNKFKQWNSLQFNQNYEGKILFHYLQKMIFDAPHFVEADFL